MFYAMAEHKIDLRGYEFEHRLEDIQTLNERAMRGELDIIGDFNPRLRLRKRSLCAALLRGEHGRWLRPDAGHDSTEPHQRSFRLTNCASCCAASSSPCPGRMTSAFLALQLFLGEFDHIVVPFDQIFETVKSGRAGVGLIIHEGQLTYASAGFKKLLDLGQWWKAGTQACRSR